MLLLFSISLCSFSTVGDERYYQELTGSVEGRKEVISSLMAAESKGNDVQEKKGG
jgi:hypothetical protein